jgi:hypothetical protein
MVIRTTVVGVLVAAAALGVAPAAEACSCAYQTPKQKLRRSDGAVIARLLDVRPIDDGDDIQSSADPTDYVYRTGRVFKGRPRLQRGRRLVVRRVLMDASCGLSHRVGRLTGLFLDREDGRWRAGTCDEVTPAQMRSVRADRAQGARGGVGRVVCRAGGAGAGRGPGLL